MNERIKELYRQAHSTRHYDGDPMREGNPPAVYWQGEASAQRFAELIIKECLEQVRDEVQYASDWQLADAVSNRVLEHFGVEQ